mgnify:CR=1 FL=1
MKDTAIRSADIDLGYFDLNTVPEQELASIPDVGPDRARELVQHRPYQHLDDVANLPGFSEADVDALRRAGATIGEAVPPIGMS